MNHGELTGQSFKVGDLVTAAPDMFPASVYGVVYRVTKVPTRANEKNYVAKPKDNPNGKGIKAPAFALNAYDPNSAEVSEVPFVPYVPTPEMGSVVKVENRPGSKMDPHALYVVLGDARKPNSVKLVKLGGEGGRYWPSVPVSMLTVVDLGHLAV